MHRRMHLLLRLERNQLSIYHISGMGHVFSENLTWHGTVNSNLWAISSDWLLLPLSRAEVYRLIQRGDIITGPL